MIPRKRASRMNQKRKLLRGWSTDALLGKYCCPDVYFDWTLSLFLLLVVIKKYCLMVCDLLFVHREIEESEILRGHGAGVRNTQSVRKCHIARAVLYTEERF
jgi:hypothetical protein